MATQILAFSMADVLAGMEPFLAPSIICVEIYIKHVWSNETVTFIIICDSKSELATDNICRT